MQFRNLVLAAVLYGASSILANGDDSEHENYKYVAVFSVDGLHSSDVGKYVSLRPKSTIADLLETGYEYTNAFTSAPSDSFPGSLNVFTGASPRTTGVWYDDVWDRSFYPPFSVSKTRCEGPAGAEGATLCKAMLDVSADTDAQSPMMKARITTPLSSSPAESILTTFHSQLSTASVKRFILIVACASIQSSKSFKLAASRPPTQTSTRPMTSSVVPPGRA